MNGEIFFFFNFFFIFLTTVIIIIGWIKWQTANTTKICFDWRWHLNCKNCSSIILNLNAIKQFKYEQIFSIDINTKRKQKTFNLSIHVNCYFFLSFKFTLIQHLHLTVWFLMLLPLQLNFAIVLNLFHFVMNKKSHYHQCEFQIKTIPD